MTFLKRIFLYVALNLLIVTTISVLLNVLHVRPYLTAQGLDQQQLLIYCLLWGMSGALMSLALSRAVAKWFYGVKLVDPATADQRSRRLVEIVYSLVDRAGLTTRPEVGVYQSNELNAFATGPSQSRALVAVSSGLLDKMSDDQLEGVLGHEITHIVNGDMVTMTLLQGVMNAFALYVSRIIAFAISSAMKTKDRWVYYVIELVLQWTLLILGSLLVCWFSRWREFRADAGGAALAGREKMRTALEALRNAVEPPAGKQQAALAMMKISAPAGGVWRFFASHPPLEERIARLK